MSPSAGRPSSRGLRTLEGVDHAPERALDLPAHETEHDYDDDRDHCQEDRVLQQTLGQLGHPAGKRAAQHAASAVAAPGGPPDDGRPGRETRDQHLAQPPPEEPKLLTMSVKAFWMRVPSVDRTTITTTATRTRISAYSTRPCPSRRTRNRRSASETLSTTSATSFPALACACPR